MKFDSYHPMLNFIYFVSVIICTVCFKHPVFVGISFVVAFAYSVKLLGKKAILRNCGFVFLAFLYAVWYASYEHFGVTVLGVNAIGNQMTFESLVYGMTIGMIAASVCIWCSCIFELMTADKIIYLFGEISPRLSLFLSIILRTIPRVKVRAKRIEISRAGIGKGVFQGSLWFRFLHLCSLISILITWTLEDFVESSNSMKSRGYSLRGRTAFSIYRFDNRDRSLVIVFSACLTLIFMGVMFGEARVYFDPKFVINPITMLSWLFYSSYACFLSLPMALQIYSESYYKKCIQKNERCA